MTTAKIFLFLGAFFALLGVSLGAFGAHALKQRLSSDMLAIFEVGVRYQMYHALGLILLGIVLNLYPDALLTWAGWFMVAGIIIFSGSLYTLSLTEIKAWGAVTPIGGFFWLIAWGLCAFSFIKN